MNKIIKMLLLVILVPYYSWADVSFRPMQLEDIPTAERQPFYKLKTASVAWANYDLLKIDFSELNHMSNSEIDDWILNNFAYISSTQLELTGIRNTPPDIDLHNIKEMGVPFGYGRASVGEAMLHSKNIGLIDQKGTGLNLYKRGSSYFFNQQKNLFKQANNSQELLDELRISGHQNGLMSLGEVVAEITREDAMSLSYKLYAPELTTVRSYFAIDTGFDILGRQDEKIPAGIYGRQAHWRSYRKQENQLSIPENIGRDLQFGARNYQGDLFGAQIDFGSVTVTTPEIAHNFDNLNPNAPMSDVINEKPWVWGHDVARAYRNGDKNALHRHLQEMTGVLKEKLKYAKETKTSFHIAIDPNDFTGSENLQRYLVAMNKILENHVPERKTFIQNLVHLMMSDYVYFSPEINKGYCNFLFEHDNIKLLDMPIVNEFFNEILSPRDISKHSAFSHILQQELVIKILSTKEIINSLYYADWLKKIILNAQDGDMELINNLLQSNNYLKKLSFFQIEPNNNFSAESLKKILTKKESLNQSCTDLVKSILMN